jgi:hypothetical protein
LKTKPTFSMKMFGMRFCETYCCPVSGCGLDCGDEGTLARHIKRMHPELRIHEERAWSYDIQQSAGGETDNRGSAARSGA